MWLVEPTRAWFNTFSFPLLLEPFDVVLQPRLLHPFEVQTFSEPVLYLVGLACSWEGSPMHLTILVDGQDMTLRDFLYFLRNRLVTVAAILDSTPLSVGSLGVPVVDLSNRDVEMQAAGSTDVNVIAIPY
ncbi:hypothetical protein Tco_1270743 [Tanacetum coccineum]